MQWISYIYVSYEINYINVQLQHGSSLVVQRSNRHAPPLALVREVKETVTVTVDGSEDDPKLFSCNDDDDSKRYISVYVACTYNE